MRNTHLPDIDSSDSFPFPKVKSSLKGTHFQSTEDTHNKMTELFKALIQNDFRGCFEARKVPMEWPAACDGNYLNMDNMYTKLFLSWRTFLKLVTLFNSHASHPMAVPLLYFLGIFSPRNIVLNDTF